MPANRLDPLTLEILWQRLITVADQMSTTLARTAFSTTITASNDYGCVLIDADAHCIAHAHRSLPIFNRTMPYTTGIVLQKFGRDNIRPGDIFISNDPLGKRRPQPRYHRDHAVFQRWHARGLRGQYRPSCRCRRRYRYEPGH